MNLGSLINMMNFASLITSLFILRLLWRMRRRVDVVGPAVYFISEIAGNTLVLLSSLNLSLHGKLFFFNFIFAFFVMGSCGWYLWLESFVAQSRGVSRGGRTLLAIFSLVFIYVCVRTHAVGAGFFVVNPAVMTYMGYPFLVYDRFSLEALMVVACNQVIVLCIVVKMLRNLHRLKAIKKKYLFFALAFSLVFFASLSVYFFYRKSVPFLSVFDVALFVMMFVKFFILCKPDGGAAIDLKMMDRYALLDKIQQGLFVVDGEGEVLDYNRAGEVAMRRAGAFDGEGRNFWGALRAIFPGFEIESFLGTEQECLVEREEQGPLLFALELQALGHENAEPDSYIVFIRDTTEARSQQLDALKFRAAFYAAADIMLICAPDGRIAHVSAGFVQQTGYEESEVKGHFLFSFKEIGPGIWEEIMEASSARRSWSGEVKGFRKDGDEVWVQMTVSPVFDRDRLASLAIVSQNITDRRIRTEQLQREAREDFLTRTINRRTFLSLAKERVGAADGVSMAILMMDVDFFKHVNDTYGHDAGDEVLKRLTQRIKELIRKDDLFARYGGEEFVLLVSGLSEEIVLCVAERIRHEVEELRIPCARTVLNATISLGVRYASDPEPLRTLLKRADEALYNAKQAGRNCVVLWKGEEESGA